MKYLGHKKVRLLDGSIDDWVEAQQPTAEQPVVLSPKTYTPTIDSGLLASFDFVKSGVREMMIAGMPVVSCA
mgnify:CR=1 FL=1